MCRHACSPRYGLIVHSNGSAGALGTRLRADLVRISWKRMSSASGASKRRMTRRSAHARAGGRARRRRSSVIPSARTYVRIGADGLRRSRRCSADRQFACEVALSACVPASLPRWPHLRGRHAGADELQSAVGPRWPRWPSRACRARPAARTDVVGRDRVRAAVSGH